MRQTKCIEKAGNFFAVQGPVNGKDGIYIGLSRDPRWGDAAYMAMQMHMRFSCSKIVKRLKWFQDRVSDWHLGMWIDRDALDATKAEICPTCRYRIVGSKAYTCMAVRSYKKLGKSKSSCQ